MLKLYFSKDNKVYTLFLFYEKRQKKFQNKIKKITIYLGFLTSLILLLRYYPIIHQYPFQDGSNNKVKSLCLFVPILLFVLKFY